LGGDARSQYFPDIARTFYDGLGIRVIADVSPIAAGHLLIIAKSHKNNFYSDLIDHSSEIRKIIRLFRAFCARDLSSLAIAFEHGIATAADEENRSSCIDHAHVHLLPIGTHLSGAMIMKGEGVSDLESKFSQMISQYYFLSDTYSIDFLSASEIFGSQFFRKSIALMMSLPFWHWLDVYLLDENNRSRYLQTENILKSFSAYLSENI
jgi:diadenosine tetraphosphate (Ap4A) HIT family hydrolase